MRVVLSILSLVVLAGACKNAPPSSATTKCAYASGDGDQLKRWLRFDGCGVGTYSVTCVRAQPSDEFRCTCAGNGGGEKTFSSKDFQVMDAGRLNVAAANAGCGWNLELAVP